jgi:hypothetical protein
MRHAAHGYGHTLFFITRSESDLQFASRQDRVIEKELVKIPQAKEEQGAGMLFFDCGVLPHQGRGRLAHLV